MNLTFNAGHNLLPKSFLSNSPFPSHVTQIDWWHFLIFRFIHLQPLFSWLPRTFYLFLSICLLSEIFFLFWPWHVACGILVPWSGIEPTRLALEAQSLNCWTTRVVPLSLSLFETLFLVSSHSQNPLESLCWTVLSTVFGNYMPLL